jgi:hypothetical protein
MADDLLPKFHDLLQVKAKCVYLTISTLSLKTKEFGWLSNSYMQMHGEIHTLRNQKLACHIHVSTVILYTSTTLMLHAYIIGNCRTNSSDMKIQG